MESPCFFCDPNTKYGLPIKTKWINMHSFFFFVLFFFLFFKLSSTNCYTPGHLPSYTRIKLGPCQSLTFNTHLKQLSFQSRNKESVLWGNVGAIWQIARFFRKLNFEPNSCIISYLEKKYVCSSWWKFLISRNFRKNKCACLHVQSQRCTSYVYICVTSNQTD